MTKKLLALLLAAVCFTLCLCGCEQPAAEPSGVLRADYWGDIQPVRSVEYFLSQYDMPQPTSAASVLSSTRNMMSIDTNPHAESYQEYLEQFKSGLEAWNIPLYWEDVEALGHVDRYGRHTHQYDLTLSAKDTSIQLTVTAVLGWIRLEDYNAEVAFNIYNEYRGYQTYPLPTKWTEITAIDNQNPVYLPQHMQAELVEGQDARYSYYATPAGFYLLYVDARLTSIIGYRQDVAIEFEWEGDYATMEDIPFDTLRQLIELATRPV